MHDQPHRDGTGYWGYSNLVSETTWRQQLHEPILKPCLLVLKGYPNNKLDILGMCEVHVTAEGVTKQLPLVICKEVAFQAETGYWNLS